MKKLIQRENIDSSIHLIRGQRVLLDENLAKIYGVETRVLNQAIRRNLDRFPEDFMFQLTEGEYSNLISQTVISSWGGRRKKPFAFTEHGTVMLASVLHSRRAIQMNIEVIKAFIRMRNVLSSQEKMSEKIDEIRSFILKQSNKTDREFNKVWRAIEDLGKPLDDESKSRIGFKFDSKR